MNQQEYSVYDKGTGLFVGSVISVHESLLKQNTPDGCLLMTGRYDYLSQRVDLATGKVIDYQPPQPGDDYEWDDKMRRWVLTAAAQATIAADREARATIEQQEGMSLRAIRELLLDPSNSDARARLQAVDESIAAQRENLKVDIQADSGSDIIAAEKLQKAGT